LVDPMRQSDAFNRPTPSRGQATPVSASVGRWA